MDGIEETEKELDSVMEHVHALEEILSRAKKPVHIPCHQPVAERRVFTLPAFQMVSFSAMKEDDLAKLGIERKLLAFCPDKLTALVQQLIAKASGEVNLLRDRILEVYKLQPSEYGCKVNYSTTDVT